jgi:GT2 family glycosyltransferase
MISIAIVHFESPALVRRCVETILENPPSETFEVLVLDNGSSPANRERLAGLDALPGVTVQSSGRNGGFAFGVNRCFERVSKRSDVVVVLNPDTEVRSTSALDALARAARRPGTALAAPLLLNGASEIERSFYRRFPSLIDVPAMVSAPVGVLADRLERLFGWHPVQVSRAEIGRSTPAHVMGAAMAIPRRAWRTVGEFDERYFLYLEETDWQFRAAARGLVVRAVPEARIVHLHRGGALEGGVPSVAFLESQQRYLEARGVSRSLVRALQGLSVVSSLVAYAALRLVAAADPQRRALARACVAASWVSLRWLCYPRRT